MRPVSKNLQNIVVRGKTLTFTKVKHGTGKHILTCGKSDLAICRKERPYMIVVYSKACKSGEPIYFSHPIDLANYVIEFCGRDVIWEKVRN